MAAGPVLEEFGLKSVALAFGVQGIRHPLLGIASGNVFGQKATEERIAGVLGSGGEQTGVTLVLHHAELFQKEGLELHPLVQSEVVKDEDDGLSARFDHGSHLRIQDLVGKHARRILGMQPIGIDLRPPAGEQTVGLLPLMLQHGTHAFRLRTLQVVVKLNQTGEDAGPRLPGIGVCHVHRQGAELRLVFGEVAVGHQLARTQHACERRQHLARLNRLEQIVGNGLANGLFHDPLLFTLGHHNDGRGGA